MKKKYLALFAALSLVLAMFSGCVKIERGIEIRPNGDLKVVSCVLMQESAIKELYETPEEFYDAMMESIDEELSLESFEKLETKENGVNWRGGRAVYDIDNSDAEESLNKVFSDYDVSYSVSGFFVKEVTLEFERTGPAYDKSIDDMGDFSQALAKATQNNFTIKVPYKLLGTNGTKVKGESNTASWSMKRIDSLGQKRITMTVSYLNLPVVLAFAGGALLIIIVLVVVLILLLRKNKKGKKPETSEQNIEVSETPQVL